jgi:cytochrome b6-f complex iron-sulfur subunit
MAAEAALRGAPAGGVTRSALLAWAGWGTMVFIGLQAAIAFVLFFWPRKLGAFGGTIPAGPADQYKPGEVRYFVDGKFYMVLLAPDTPGAGAGAGGFMALFQKCPHLGCTVPWRPDFTYPYEGQEVTGLFRCPCHGSTYLKTGQIIFGPAPRPMDYMRITSEGGTLLVNTGAIRKRDAYDPSQVYKPQ